MLSLIDSYLNKTTMYRVVLYFLLALLGIAFVLALFGLLPYNAFAILFSAAFISLICKLSNDFIARVYKAQTNSESYLITALILALVISPPTMLWDPSYLQFALWASILAMASKYFIALGKKHVFNPVAIAVVITAFALGNSASWWIGTAIMAPFVIIFGLIETRKIIRFDLVLSFFAFAIISCVGAKLGGSLSVWEVLKRLALDTPLFFFAFVMLTEPLTTPPTRPLRIAYGAIVGFLFAPWVHIGSIYSTPELALVIGNVFSYVVSPKQKLLLTLREKAEAAAGVLHFSFASDKSMEFAPGQYMEWTLSHAKPDRRGNRRFFTIASSPTEPDVMMGVKFYPGPSTYKQKLSKLEPGDTIIAGQLAGDFTLPEDTNRKLAFIAGGIGVTPFRAMVKYLIDKGEKRDIMMFYAVKNAEDIAYKEIFDEAEGKLGMKIVYAVADAKEMPRGLTGYTGFIDKKIIETELPDYAERFFYISGPRSMIDAYKKTLSDLGVHSSHIKEDFFPGFA